MGQRDDEKPEKKSLKDAEIVSDGVGRRAALSLLGAGVTGAALVAGTDQAHAATDSDQGANSDPPNRGRGYPRGRASGVTDNDGGNFADPPSNGRGGPAQRRAGVTDNDPSADPAGQGRGFGRGRTSGHTDRDPSADPAGNGRDL